MVLVVVSPSPLFCVVRCFSRSSSRSSDWCAAVVSARSSARVNCDGGSTGHACSVEEGHAKEGRVWGRGASEI